MDVTAPPGWYHDGYGVRWWSGDGWGPYAPPPQTIGPDPRSDQAGKTLAIIAHLGAFFGGFILPLIIYLTQKDTNDYAASHAREALNFQLTVMIVWLIAWLSFIPTMILTVNEKPTGFPWPIAVVFPIFFIGMIASWAFGIVGAVKASHMKRWRYPVRIPFFRASTVPTAFSG